MLSFQCLYRSNTFRQGFVFPAGVLLWNHVAVQNANSWTHKLLPTTWNSFPARYPNSKHELTGFPGYFCPINSVGHLLEPFYLNLTMFSVFLQTSYSVSNRINKPKQCSGFSESLTCTSSIAASIPYLGVPQKQNFSTIWVIVFIAIKFEIPNLSHTLQVEITIFQFFQFILPNYFPTFL